MPVEVQLVGHGDRPTIGEKYTVNDGEFADDVYSRHTHVQQISQPLTESDNLGIDVMRNLT